MRFAWVLLFAAAACGDDGGDACEPLYQGNATDEAWRTMVDALGRVQVGSPMAATFTTPTEGQIMTSSDGPPLVSWSSPIAKPHLPPLTGDVYLVEIAVPGLDCPIAVLTTEESWQLEGGSWVAITTGGAKTLEVSITSAYLVEGRITEGPFQPSAPRTFKIQ